MILSGFDRYSHIEAVALSGQQTLVELHASRTNEDVRMYIEEFYSSRYLDTLLCKLELDMHWKCCGLYTIATMEEKCENCS